MIANNATEAAILGRVIQPDRGDLSPDAANAILGFGFDEQDRLRMHELATKNQADALTPEELQELDNYRHVGRLLDVLRSKARQSLSHA